MGGGGAGKSTIINKVLTPLVEAYYGGPQGLQKAAPSNKAARQIGGQTLHATVGLKGHSNLATVSLWKTNKEKEFSRRVGLLGAIVWDEVSQINSRLAHAHMYLVANGRAVSQAAGERLAGQMTMESEVRVDAARYTELDQSWGAVPVVVIAGDELQFPCVPQQAGLLAPIFGTTDEQKAAVKVFSSFDRVYRLRTAKRFEGDPMLKCILDKMRIKGGFKLSPKERKALKATNIKDGDLEGTELWYESAFQWSNPQNKLS